jgi:hypothetical protein
LHGKTCHRWPSSIAYFCHETLSTSCQLSFWIVSLINPSMNPARDTLYCVHNIRMSRIWSLDCDSEDMGGK